MKKRGKLLAIVALTIMLGQKAISQQEPMYTQYMFNTLSVNPAYAGTSNALNLLALSRLQWVGLEGAPRTSTFALHTPLNGKKVGVGFSMVSDEIGPVKNYYFSGNYAYRIKLTEKLTLSLGIKGGIYSYKIGLKNLETGAGNDPAFQQDQAKKLNPNAGAGAYLYTSKYYIGLAVPKLFQHQFDKERASNSSLSKLKRHYFIMGGYGFVLNPDLALKPSFVTKIVDGAPPSTDITGQFLLKEMYWFGMSYRIGDAIAFLFEVKINPQMTIGYSYDANISKLSGFNSG